MAQAGPSEDRLTDYERAICYYALPKIINPITLGVIVAYAVCVFEAVAALTFGLVTQRLPWIEGGAWALAGIMVFGIVVFMGRAFLNELRERRLLAAARGVPNALREIRDVPDPFADHVLLRHPAGARGLHFDCTGGDFADRYRIEGAPDRSGWSVQGPDGEELCRVKVLGGPPSFMISMGVPSRLTVYNGDEVIAEIVRRFSFSSLVVDISCLKPVPVRYVVRGQTVFREGVVSGRIYELRHSVYLDIKRDALHVGLFGFFATLS